MAIDIRPVIAKVAGLVSNHALPFSGPVVETVVGEILSVQDEQLAILRNLDSTMQRLADVPSGSARIYLEEAKLPGRSPEQVRRSFEFAADKLHDAIPAASANSTNKADARLLLATV